MTQEAYCSKEVYRLLIKKGFKGEIHTTFDNEGYTQAAITHQTAMAWLREVHGIHIAPIPCTTPQHTIVWMQNILNLNPVREGGMFLQLEPNKKCYNSHL